VLFIGCLYFLLPAFFTISIFVTYAVLFGVGSMGTVPQGERLEMRFATCPGARSFLDGRIEQMGLGDPKAQALDDGYRVVATLPEGPVGTHVPATLARTGRFTIRQGDRPDGAILVDHDGVEKAEMSLKELGNPLVIVTLKHAAHKTLESWMETHLTEQIGVWIDEERVLIRPADPPHRHRQLDVRAEGPDGLDNLRRAADWGILLTHGPLPCPATVATVATAPGA
jgi:hypothetical protein